MPDLLEELAVTGTPDTSALQELLPGLVLPPSLPNRGRSTRIELATEFITMTDRSLPPNDETEQRIGRPGDSVEQKAKLGTVALTLTSNKGGSVIENFSSFL
jgi:hypothetical protein